MTTLRTNRTVFVRPFESFFPSSSATVQGTYNLSTFVGIAPVSMFLGTICVCYIFFREAFHRKKWRMKSIEICTLRANYLESKWYNFKGSLECIGVAPATFQVTCLQTYTYKYLEDLCSICTIFAPTAFNHEKSVLRTNFHRSKGAQCHSQFANGKCLPLLIQPTPFILHSTASLVSTRSPNLRDFRQTLTKATKSVVVWYTTAGSPFRESQ